MPKKLLSFLMMLIMAFTLLVPSKMVARADIKELKGTARIEDISKYGNVYLSIKYNEILDAGYQYGDIVTLSFLDKTMEVPFCRAYSDVETGKVAVFAREEEKKVLIAINMGDFATTYNLAEKTTAEDRTYKWVANPEVSFPVEFSIKMSDPGGYFEAFMLHQMTYTTNRADYSHLSDEEFANFREVTTTGIGKGRLYRSSSPIDPDDKRSAYADKALKKEKVTVILNLADNEVDAMEYPGFDKTYYSKQKFIALNMSMDYEEKDFQDKLATGLRFMIDNPGVYEIHCKEGKDRSGFVCALLECLMGASYEEVIDDYATTYYNYYGIKKGDEKYDYIVENLKKILTKTFMKKNPEKADLSEAATKYINRLGLTDKEISELKKNLSADK